MTTADWAQDFDHLNVKVNNDKYLCLQYSPYLNIR